MKLFKKIRKGFTLIELVVVIAVIAILSAVAVVSYISITNKAKTSSDEQAVRQMNTILQANSVMDLKSINDVYAAFEENDINAENYKPLVKDRYFFWDSKTNQIVYTDKDYVVIYPESRKGETKGDHQWYSLTQSLAKTTLSTTETFTLKDKEGNVVDSAAKTKEIEGTKEAGKTYSYAVQSAEELYTVGQELKDAMLSTTSKTAVESNGYVVQTDYTNKDGKSVPNVTYIVGDVEINLAGDLDLMGGSFNFCVKGNFKLNGNGYTIKGIVNNRDFVVGASKQQGGASQAEVYGTGILGYIASPTIASDAAYEAADASKHGTAEFKNVTIENCVFGYSEGKGAGLVGYTAYSDITFENVSMKNCSCEGFEHSVGGFVGDTQSYVTITLKGTNEVRNTSLKITEGNDSAKECYGAGYFIGRQTNDNLVVTLADGASFAQSGNSKTFNTKQNAAGKTSYWYWDDAVKTNRKNVDK